jgi:hypothetical protein
MPKKSTAMSGKNSKAETTKFDKTADVGDSALDDGATGTKRKLRGIHLGRNIDIAMDPRLMLAATAMPTPSARSRPAAPAVVEPPSCLGMLWSCLFNPSPLALAVLATLTLVLAVFAFAPESNDESSATLATPASARYATNRHPAYSGPDANYSTAYRLPAGPGYRGPYDYY